MGRSRKAAEKARRVYGELVRGRTRVQIVTADVAAADTPARFLLAPYRSGTTLVRYCLDSHPDLAVPPETDFMAPILGVLDDAPSMSGFAGVGFEERVVVNRLAEFLRAFHDTYARVRSASGGWLDKSPRYAENPEQIARAFPDARYLVLHRHPLDQVHSFTRGGTFAHPALGRAASGLELIELAASYWNSVVAGLIEFADEHAESCISVRYEALCERPRDVLTEVLEHLQLPWSDNVLEYHKFDHDLGREAGRVAGTVGFSISSGGWKQWPANWQDRAKAITRETAARAGYDDLA